MVADLVGRLTVSRVKGSDRWKGGKLACERYISAFAFYFHVPARERMCFASALSLVALVGANCRASAAARHKSFFY
jgi:hypothetical protein